MIQLQERLGSKRAVGRNLDVELLAEVDKPDLGQVRVVFDLEDRGLDGRRADEINE